MNDNEPLIKGRAFECPHCKGIVYLEVKTELAGVRKFTDLEAKELRDFTPESKKLLEDLHASDLIDVFGVMARYAHGDQCPKNLTRFFTTFVRAVVPRKIAPFAVDSLRKEFGSGQLQFWQANSMGAIV